MDFLFGSKPKVEQPPSQPTVSGPQTGVQNQLASLFSLLLNQGSSAVTGGQPAFPATQQFAAPLTGTQTSLIDQIVAAGGGGGATAAANAPINTAQQALTQILSGQPIDYSQYFQKSIADPLERTFSNQTIPALQAAFAKSAGGTNSVGANTGFSSAVGQAAEGLDQQLAAAQASIGAGAVQQAQQLRSTGVSQAPGLAQQILSNIFGPLQAASGAAALPQQTQQTQLTGQANQTAQMLQFLSNLFGQSGQFSTASTVQPNTVVLPGQQGIVQSALDAFAGSAGRSVGSDPRLKSIKKGPTPSAVEILKGLKVKNARYFWEPEGSERHMLMADNVAKKVPAAAEKIANLGFIKPHELIPLLVKGMQELAEAA